MTLKTLTEKWFNPSKYSDEDIRLEIEAFEKRQRWFLNPMNMGAWLTENSDTKSTGELFERFIKTEVLGE